MFDKVVAFVRREPVRAVVWPLIVAGIGALVASGKVTDSFGDILSAAVAAVLFGAGAEVARSQVKPVVKE